MIQIQNVSKSFGVQVLLDGASMLVGDHERVGLVGRNGCGKSTLFKMILGQECLDGGSIDIPKKYTLGYLQQHLNFTHATVHEEACSVLKPNEDGWIEEHKVEAILFGLGFDEESMHKSPMLLSGGFQIRLNLAKVLASEPDMLLLDEPTNYLDIVSMRWLSRFLRSWKGEVLLITHDHHFMDEVCTHTAGIFRHKIRKVKGSVEKLRETVAEEEEVAQRTQENEAKKKAQLEQVIERFRYKAAKAAMVQSKIKAVAKLATGERLTHERNLEFSFTEAGFPGKRMLQIKGLSFAYPNRAEDGTVQGMGPELITDLTMEVFKGDRIAIIGPNGRGKTTLLNLIAKELSPTAGEISHNPNLQINYFGQTNINRLNLDNTVEEEIASAIEEVAQKSRARGLAGLMMFSGDAALKKVKVLSGGERSRVLLGKILASPCNMLLLDEPTNHLDMESIESLIDALDDYEGTAMVVTHDEELLHAFATRLVVFDGGKCRVFEGTYADFLEKVGWASEKKPGGSESANIKVSNIDVKTDGGNASANNAAGGAPRAKEDRKARADYIAERSKVIKPLEKKLAKLEEDIAKAEALGGELEAKLVTASETGDGNAITAIAKDMDDNKKKVDQLYEEWEKVSAELEAAKDKYPI
ncbi:ABC-F family ATP-binding cassette domain-containing protein [Fibrobacter sp. UWH4]|uniref:ABC-F family ATP-binding cassette domain-containing protein n=1 Tax=Fibrobacter sp. UWH4 TaxID=1896210 RepID=UPI000917B905|nr:ABC-F family ATP-binding cassette domain-containing protein [Fibrobacter sp. UWH4]SHL58338.1 ATP-binding cassette, subfamily F, member 3 [Fibrobacter sp. UWH4]